MLPAPRMSEHTSPQVNHRGRSARRPGPTPQADGFAAFLGRVQAGDADATAELVRLCEPWVRRIVRLRLTDPRLRRVLDFTDVCQAVLGSLFVRIVAGRYELDGPDDLGKLLTTMPRNTVYNQIAYHRAACRDPRRVQFDADGVGLDHLVSREPGPGRVAAGRDLLVWIRQHLNASQWYLAEQRAAGRDWGSRPRTRHQRGSPA